MGAGSAHSASASFPVSPSVCGFSRASVSKLLIYHNEDSGIPKCVGALGLMFPNWIGE